MKGKGGSRDTALVSYCIMTLIIEGLLIFISVCMDTLTSSNILLSSTLYVIDYYYCIRYS